MTNSNLSYYSVKSEDLVSTNLDGEYSRVKFYKQLNFVVCEFLLVTVDFANTIDHNIIHSGKIPSAFRPATTFKQDVTDYCGLVRHALLTITSEGGMKLAMGTANTHMRIYGSIMYPAKVIDSSEEIYFFILSAPSEVQKNSPYTISVLVKNNENTPLSKSVVLKKDGVSLGTFQTDSNGVASTSINGNGVGTVTLVAECEQSRSEIQILDCMFYDSGMQGSNNSNWVISDANVFSSSTNEEGTTLSIVNATTSTYYQQTGNGVTGDFEATVYIENSSGTDTRFGVLSGGTRRYIRMSGNYYLKLVRINGTTNAYYSEDGETWTQKAMNGTEPNNDSVYLYIGIYNTSSTAKTMLYRNLKAYPIVQQGE